MWMNIIRSVPGSPECLGMDLVDLHTRKSLCYGMILCATYATFILRQPLNELCHEKIRSPWSETLKTGSNISYVILFYFPRIQIALI